MDTTFIAIDVETANADYSSICQIGAVKFVNGRNADTLTQLINPTGFFDPFNVSIHGIDEAMVANAPSYESFHDELSNWIGENTLVHHGHFDRTAFTRLFDIKQLNPFKADWIDNTRVVRRVWSEFANSGYGLKNLAGHFEIPLDHHDALSDAVAAGEIFLKAGEKSGLSVAGLLALLGQPVNSESGPKDVRRLGNVDAPFFGDKIVFTGAMQVARQTAADVAQDLGFDVQNGVNKKTTYICVGIQDPRSLAGYEKSSKHRKAEQLIVSGQEIAIISEEDFWQIAKTYSCGEV